MKPALPVLCFLLAASGFACLCYAHLTISGDFKALWSYGRFLADHSPAGLYDAAGLDAYQAGLGLDTRIGFPFAYPPTFLLFVAPLGVLPIRAAFVAFFALTIAAFVWASAGRQPGPVRVLTLLVAPATTAGVMAGQTGFLAGALLIGGLRLAERRPWLAGVLLGLLTCKPQLGLLVPVALVSAGAWRAVGTTIVAAAALAGMATGLFGVRLWWDWVSSLSAYSAWFEAQAALLPYKPTLAANMDLLGVPQAGTPLQVAALLLMAAVVWAAFHRGISLGAIGVLVAATVFANPHAFYYDLPMVTAAVLFMGAARVRTRLPLRVWECVLLGAVLWLPAAMLLAPAFDVRVPISLPVLLGFAGWAAWQTRLGTTAPETAGDRARQRQMPPLSSPA